VLIIHTNAWATFKNALSCLLHYTRNLGLLYNEILKKRESV
jgi:hypothetical protein